METLQGPFGVQASGAIAIGTQLDGYAAGYSIGANLNYVSAGFTAPSFEYSVGYFSGDVSS